MNDERSELVEWAGVISRWSKAAEGVIAESLAYEEVIDYHAIELARAVCIGEVTVKELRQGVIWASALDRESVECFGVSIEVGPERLERAARRVMHHAGREALEQVKTERRLLKTRRELKI